MINLSSKRRIDSYLKTVLVIYGIRITEHEMHGRLVHLQYSKAQYSAVQYSAVQRRVHLVDAGGGVDPVLQVQQDLGPGLQQAQRQAGHQYRHL